MNKKVLQIGEEVVFEEAFEIEGITGDKIKVEIGDKAFVVADGFLRHTNGKAAGKMQELAEDVEIKGYDHEGIAKIIWRRLNNYFDIREFLYDYDVSEQEMKDVIEKALSDIL